MTETASDLPVLPFTRGCPFDPPEELGRLRSEDPVTRVRLWDGSAPWLITGYDEQRAVLSDPRFSADVTKPGYPHVTEASAARRQRLRAFITMDNPEHNVHRKMLTPNFTIKRIEALRPRVQQITDELIDKMLAKGGPVDLVQDLALPLPSLVICELLGVPYDDHELFQRCSKTVISTRSTVEESLAASDELRDYLSGLVSRKVKDPGDDLLSRLAGDQLASGALNQSEVTDMAVLLLIAGHETTANMTALGTLALLEHPEQLAEVRDSEDPRWSRAPSRSC